MSLLSFHIEFAETNKLLRRIADTLDRAIPPVADHQAYSGKQTTVADISRSTDPKRRELEREKISLDRNIWRRYAYPPGQQKEGRREPPEGQKVAERAAVSRTGQYDHDDPLDIPDWLDEDGTGDAGNYPGV